ncbi:sterol carrier protein 2, partial [Goodea atripinnis]
ALFSSQSSLSRTAEEESSYHGTWEEEQSVCYRCGHDEGEKALTDAGVPYSAIEQACVGYVYGDSTCGQRAIYHSLGLTGIPIINVNNNCSTGSTALFMARQLIQGGESSWWL